MKKIEECLDLVLKTLSDNKGLLCLYETEDIQSFINHKYSLSSAFEKMFREVELSDDEIIQLLQILTEQEQIKFARIDGGTIPAYVFIKIKSDNSSRLIPKFKDDIIGKPDKLELTIKGKFFILGGGYTGEIKKEARKDLLQTLAIWITAIGTGLGGIYVIGKAIIWLYSLFKCN